MMFGHGKSVRRGTKAALLGAMLAGLPLQARAAEPEGIHLTLDAPPECLGKEDLVAQVEALGAHVRPARSEERARAFAVTIAPEQDKVTARLVVRDLVGQTTERTVTGRHCAEAARSVALLVALALDDADAAQPQPAATAPPLAPALWPAPASGDTPTAGMRVHRVRVGRQGSGGFVVTGTYGPQLGVEVAGARAYAAARIFGSTRIGASLALASERHRRTIFHDGRYDSSGWAGRVGAIIGWGAPWSDAVAGFVGEAGLAAGRQSGVAYAEGMTLGSLSCEGAGCSEVEARVRSSFRFLSPFVATSLVLQIPWKAPVRPVAGFTTTATFGREEVATLSFTGDLGLVWQAW